MFAREGIAYLWVLIPYGYVNFCLGEDRKALDVQPLRAVTRHNSV